MNILYIGLDYYRYPKEIIREFESKGHEVDFYPIEPRSMFYKITRYAAPAWYQRSLDEYHSTIIEGLKDKTYDLVFFITTHFMSESNFKKLKERQSGARFVAYHWDSLVQYDYRAQLEYFDSVFTFDRADSETLGINYLPLFASGPYVDMEIKPAHSVDVYTISSIVNPERYLQIERFRQWARKNEISFDFFLKVTPITYLRILLKGVVPKGVSFNSIDSTQMFSMIESARCALDIANHKQSGLTMRIIENAFIGKKIVTTNTNVRNEDFFAPQQFHLIESFESLSNSDLEKLSYFLRSEVTLNKIDSLSIKNWTTKLLS